MKTWIMVWCAAVVAVVSAGCRTPAPASQSGKSAPPAELMQTNTLSEVGRHLYRWYMDENDVERIANDRDLVFWVWRVKVQLDPGDESVFAEIALPQLDTTIVLKKANYMVEETKTRMRRLSFMAKWCRAGRAAGCASIDRMRPKVASGTASRKVFLNAFGIRGSRRAPPISSSDG